MATKSTTGSMAASGNVLTVADPIFTAAMVGKATVVVKGAGASGGDLTSAVSSVLSDRSVTLATPATTAVIAASVTVTTADGGGDAGGGSNGADGIEKWIEDNPQIAVMAALGIGLIFLAMRR